ncbi:MAG: SDR family oxidoreductase [Clostridiales bacterium]|nr:SDR family oxidoreductase [Clostridiales bacterium]
MEGECMASTVWISGASSGLGLHTARALEAAGFSVIAGARSFSEQKEAGLWQLPLDVTDEKSIDHFVETALSIGGAPDILINCAGVLILGACESYAPDELRQVLETNFLGQAAMISRVLPLMRQRGKGRIVNFSSVNGLLGIPFQGAYVASKHAIEGYSECLALECRPFGVEVMLVEPGDHRSGSKNYRRISRGMGEENPYKPAFETATQRIAWDEAHGCDPDKLGRKIAKVLKKRHMPRRLRVASLDQHLAVWLHDLLPAWLFDWIIGSYYRK